MSVWKFVQIGDVIEARRDEGSRTGNNDRDQGFVGSGFGAATSLISTLASLLKIAFFMLASGLGVVTCKVEALMKGDEMCC